jgi:pyruvate-formate lyase-activating enzyme
VDIPQEIHTPLALVNMEIFGKEIPLRQCSCSLFGQDRKPVCKPYVNLYVRFKGCNAKCDFCEFIDTAQKFDFDKYVEIIRELDTKLNINKINFTGGEPTLNFAHFEKVFYTTITNESDPNILYTLNTNGYNLKKVFDNRMMLNRIKDISLSRHHYDDDINNEIFKTKVISSDEIRELLNKQMKKDHINLTCNLIKGYIDSKEEIHKYIEHAADLDIHYMGLVSLMPINDFCKDQFVDVKKLDLETDRFNLTKKWTKPNECECFNYIYIPEDLKRCVKVYHKNTYNPQIAESMLSFDGQNLRVGFTGEIII